MSRIELDISDDDLDRIIDEADDIEHDDSGLDVDDILQENEKEEAQHLATLKRRRTVSKGQTPESHRAAEKAEHPLTAIEKYEKDISYKLGGQTSLDSKFLLSNYRKIFDSNFTNVSFGNLEAIAKTCFNNASNLTPKQKKESWGTPKSIAVLPPKYIAIGTSKGAVLVFDYGQSGFHIINANNGQDFGAVTALDLSIRDDGLVCGFESGHITLWGISKNEHIKVIPPTENCSILAVKFWKDTRSNVIASNSQGFVYLYKLDSVFFQWVIDKKVLVSPDRRPTNSSGADSNKNVPDGFLTIQVLKKEISEGHSLSRYSVVAMGSLKMVLVMTLEPEIHRVFKFDRPASISPFSVPSISWGKGALLGYENNRHPLLAVAWGNDLDIFQFQSVDEEFAKNIKYVASYNSKTELYHIEWISENNILAYDYNREFKLLYLSKFKSRLNMAQSQDFDYSEAETPLMIPDPDVAFDIYNYILENRFETSHQERPIMFFNNAIVGFPSLRRVFILGFSTVSLARHYDWKEYLEQLKNKADWLAALSFYVTLYKGTNKVFAGLPIDPVKVKEFIRPYSASLVRDYLTSISKANGISASMNDMWKTAMLTVIDFLITVDNFEFLFRETKKTFEEWGMRDGFFEALEAFILRNRVKYVPNEPFRDLVDYYASTDKKDLLQYLIINLSLNTVDVDNAITVCMEFNLLTSLLYLCTHREGAEGADFLTPIARSLSTYQKSVEEQNPDKEEYGLKFLWILNMILQGRTFPDGEIPDHIWRQKVEDILFLVFEEMNVGLILQIDPQIGFEIFYLFFEAKLSALLDSYDGTIQILDISNQTAENNGERHMNPQLKRILELFIETMGNRLQIQILALVYYCAKKDEEYHNMLYYMLADLTYKEKIKLPEKIMEECLLYLLKVPRELPPWGSSYKKSSEKHPEEENNDSAEDRSKLIVYLLKRLETKLGPEKIKGFAKLIEQSDFVDVKVYLSQIKHEYKKCFDMYLNQAQAEHRMKIFDWLDSVIHSLKDNHPEYFKDVKDSLLYRLRELVALNSEKTRNIILGLDRNLEVEAIKQLEPIPKLQLEYLKGMFANREAINTIPDDLLILHLRLLCQMEPKNVLKELESYPYPLDSSMKLCREYDVRDGLAFLLERAGNILESLRVTLGLFRMSLEEKLRKIEREKVFNESGTLVRKLSHAKEICLKYNKLGDRESDALWFSVLDSVLGCYHDYIANNKAIQEALKQDDNIPQNKAYRKLSKAFADYISNLFEDMTKCVAVESILAKLEDYSSLKLGDLKTSLLGVLRTYHYESNILEEARALLIGDMFDILGGVLYTTKQGSWTSKPNVPRDFIDTMAIFNCGHVFPRDCVKGILCAVCADQESLKVNSVISQTKRIGAPGRNRPPPSQGSSREGGSSMNPQDLLQQDKERLASAASVGYTFQDSGNKKLRYISKLRLYEQALQDDNDWEEDNYESYL